MQITKKHLMQLQLKLDNLKSYQQELVCNITNYSKSLIAYVRSKQNVRDKVGPLEDSAGNIIAQGFLMAEDLNS